MKYLIGLTGLIGSGKSIVAEEFTRLGIDIIDTDAIAHKITGINGIALENIKNTFGKTYITQDNAMNRIRMRELVFRNLEAKMQLEEILHPLIFAKTEELIAQSTSTYTVIAVPLLFKSLKYMSLIHRSIFVDCSEEQIIERVILRSSLTIPQIKSILENQTPRAIQMSLCDDILNNNKSINELYNSVLKLDAKYKDLYQNIL